MYVLCAFIISCFLPGSKWVVSYHSCSLYILNTSPWSNTCFVYIFSHRVACIFIFLTTFWRESLNFFDEILVVYFYSSCLNVVFFMIILFQINWASLFWDSNFIKFGNFLSLYSSVFYALSGTIIADIFIPFKLSLFPFLFVLF